MSTKGVARHDIGLVMLETREQCLDITITALILLLGGAVYLFYLAVTIPPTLPRRVLFAAGVLVTVAAGVYAIIPLLQKNILLTDRGIARRHEKRIVAFIPYHKATELVFSLRGRSFPDATFGLVHFSIRGESGERIRFETASNSSPGLLASSDADSALETARDLASAAIAEGFYAELCSAGTFTWIAGIILAPDALVKHGTFNRETTCRYADLRVHCSAHFCNLMRASSGDVIATVSPDAANFWPGLMLINRLIDEARAGAR